MSITFKTVKKTLWKIKFGLYFLKYFFYLFLQVELAHGGRGNPSSGDRHSSQNGFSGARGVSRRTEHRGNF